MFIRIVSLAAMVGFAGLGASEDKKLERPKSDPESTPLEITITGKVTKYTLDTGGLSSADYKKQLESVKGQSPGPTPAVDLTLEIKNTSDKPVLVWLGGDPVEFVLELKGKGAVNANPEIAFTEEFRRPIPVEIAAGKTHSLAFKSLQSGFRGANRFAYWTEPCDYELVASLRTGMSPAPKGAKEAMNGFGRVTVTSPAFKLTVEEKK